MSNAKNANRNSQKLKKIINFIELSLNEKEIDIVQYGIKSETLNLLLSSRQEFDVDEIIQIIEPCNHHIKSQGISKICLFTKSQNAEKIHLLKSLDSPVQI